MVTIDNKQVSLALSLGLIVSICTSDGQEIAVGFPSRSEGFEGDYNLSVIPDLITNYIDGEKVNVIPQTPNGKAFLELIG